jgi:hypothetical protein
MDVESQILSAALRWLAYAKHEVPWERLFYLTVILRLYRKGRYSSEALRRARERLSRQKRAHMMQLKETVKTMLEIFSKAPAPRLKDLAEDIENDFDLRS